MAYKILLPFDSSVCSLKAAEYTAQLMNTNDDIYCTALFVRAFTRDLALFLGESRESYDDSTEKLTSEMEKKVKLIFKNLARKVKIQIIEGDPVQVICRVAKNEGYNEIIMGFLGGNSVGRLLQGSISCKIAENVACPVRIVK